MIYIFTAISVFILAVLFHIILYRTLARKTIWGIWLFSIFLLGFFINLIAVKFVLPRLIVSDDNFWNHPLPFCAVFLYMLFVAIFFIFYIISFFGDKSPSNKIYESVKRYHKQSEKDLIAIFDNEVLISKRLRELIKAGMVKKKYEKLFISSKGRYFIHKLNIYRYILNWNSNA